ncbi:MAG: guanylate kinase [Burkholderiaceae bacterium]|nr:guanylate kinase [Burkholderiaceae bacterium]
MSDTLREITPKRSGSLFLVSAPSGAGKSSLVNALLAKVKDISLSISYTTRSPRPGEQNGREYHFVTVEEFLKMREEGDFLESAEVHGNYYGTSRKWIENKMAEGVDVLLEIDWQGAFQVFKQFPEVISIFILPPSMQALEERLHKRGQDSEETIAKRLRGAGAEMVHADGFQFVIINEDFERSLDEFHAIVSAGRLRFEKQAARRDDVFTQLGIPH